MDFSIGKRERKKTPKFRQLRRNHGHATVNNDDHYAANYHSASTPTVRIRRIIWIFYNTTNFTRKIFSPAMADLYGLVLKVWQFESRVPSPKKTVSTLSLVLQVQDSIPSS